jgi:imidazolonepropionase-like amidohydrolase
MNVGNAMALGQEIVIANAQLIDGTGSPPRPNTSVLIQGGRFQKIVEGEIKNGPRAIRIDAAGKTLMPGLFDMHAHLLSGGFDSITKEIDSFDPAVEKRALMQMLYWGVTTVCNPVQPLSTAGELRTYVQENSLLAPRVLLSGPGFTAPGGWAGSLLPIARMEPDDSASANHDVNILADHSVDFLKIYYDAQCCAFVSPLPKLKKAVMEAIVKAAHSRQLKVMVHAYDTENHLDALRAGADIMAHSAVTAEIDDEYLRLAQQNKTLYLATLSVYHDAFDPLTLREFISQDFVQRTVLKRTLDTLAEGGPLDGFIQSVKKEYMNGQFPVIQKNLKKLFDHGIPIAIGPDTGIMGAFPGISVHREMELMAAAGIPLAELLVAATSTPARFMNLPSIGTIHEGNIADAVITNESPLDDIRNTRQIAAVIKEGAVVNRGELLHRILTA